MKDRIANIQKIQKELAATSNAEEKEALRNDFWFEALSAFNENIAGEVVTITGEVLYTPPFEI